MYLFSTFCFDDVQVLIGDDGWHIVFQSNRMVYELIIYPLENCYQAKSQIYYL